MMPPAADGDNLKGWLRCLTGQTVELVIVSERGPGCDMWLPNRPGRHWDACCADSAGALLRAAADHRAQSVGDLKGL